MPTVKEMKIYLGIDGNYNDSLIVDFLQTAKDLVEKVLRYELSKLNPVPSIIKEMVKYATAYLYNNRETADMRELENTLSVALSGYRKKEF